MVRKTCKVQTRGVRGQKIQKNANVICERPLHTQGGHVEFEPDKAHSIVVGIIPLVEIGLTVIQTLGKAQALEV